MPSHCCPSELQTQRLPAMLLSNITQTYNSPSLIPLSSEISLILFPTKSQHPHCSLRISHAVRDFHQHSGLSICHQIKLVLMLPHGYIVFLQQPRNPSNTLYLQNYKKINLSYFKSLSYGSSKQKFKSGFLYCNLRQNHMFFGKTQYLLFKDFS